MRFTLKPFEDLTLLELYAVLRLRQRVFVVEQACVYLDCDGADPKALHLWGGTDDDPFATYARLFAPGLKYDEAAIGRVVTAPEWRGRGLGRELMQEALRVCDERFGTAPVKISAQAYLTAFYEGLGFRSVSATYLDDGIPHLDMVRP